jgi:hypothetical protein
MGSRSQQGIREQGSRGVGTLCAKRFVQRAFLIVRPRQIHLAALFSYDTRRLSYWVAGTVLSNS